MKSITSKSLDRLIDTKDLNKHPHLQSDTDRQQVVRNAFTRFCQNGHPFEIAHVKMYGKYIHYFNDFPSTLLFRNANNIFSHFSKTKQKSRDEIIKTLLNFLQSGENFRLYKLDIKSFYESINSDELIELIYDNHKIPRSSCRLIKNLLENIESDGFSGVPRGIPISTSLAEYYMSSFDQKIKGSSEVYFYCRFVDDIIIITRGHEKKKSFLKFIGSTLPAGIRINHSPKKFKVVDFSGGAAAQNSNDTIEGNFDYLGYNFKVMRMKRRSPDGRKVLRNVYLDISEGKTKKIKTKIWRSFNEYDKTRDINLLVKRLMSLTGNYKIYDARKKRTRTTGLYRNYKFTDSKLSSSLPSIDGFYRAMIEQFLPSRNFLGIDYSPEREILFKYSFVRFFDEKPFYNFSKDDLSEIKRCWKNV